MGYIIISGSMDGTIRVWDAKSGKELKRLTHTQKNNEATQGVNSVSVSADGLYVASGGVDGCVCKWDTKTWTREELVGKNEEPVSSVSISENGLRVVSGSWDNSVIMRI